MGMDYLVEFRRNQIQAEVDDFSVSEERLIMPGKLLPVSYAHYSGKLPVTAEKQTWWVATIVTDDASIEVIAGSTRGAIVDAGMERLVKSTRITEESGEPCGVK